MSYRELRGRCSAFNLRAACSIELVNTADFTEIMRALGYVRPISVSGVLVDLIAAVSHTAFIQVENFREPNFKLVADTLYWLVQRLVPFAWQAAHCISH